MASLDRVGVGIDPRVLAVAAVLALASAPVASATPRRDVIVQYPDAPETRVLDAVDDVATILTTYDVIPGAHVRVAADRVDDLRGIDGVERVDPVVPVEPKLDVSRPNVRVGPTFWDAQGRGDAATIAVVDSGIDETHPALLGKVEASIVFPGAGQGGQEVPTSEDEDGHGTHVAGIVAGTGGGSSALDRGDRTYAGMAPAASLVSLDVSESWSSANLLKALDWIHDNYARYDIGVVQNSWGRTRVGDRYDPGDPLVRASTRLVEQDDLAVVFAAGNAGPDPSTLPMEAQNPHVLSVGAVDDGHEPAEFSSRGPVVRQDGSLAPWTKPDIVAPGVQIKSAAASSRSGSRAYVPLSGTSMAAPHASGVLAILRDRHPAVSARNLVAFARANAIDLGPQGPDNVTGWGFLDARAVSRALAGARTVQHTETYTHTGTLTMGAPRLDILNGRGLHFDHVESTFAVTPGAKRVDYTFTWTTDEPDATAPTVQVTLTGPGGEEREVPADGREHALEIQEPEAGTWTWRAEAEDGSGSIEYSSTAKVVQAERIVSDPRARSPPAPGADVTETWRRFLLEAEAWVVENPVAAGGIGAAVLAGIVVAWRRR